MSTTVVTTTWRQRFMRNPLVRGILGFSWLLVVTVAAYAALSWVPVSNSWGRLAVAVVVAAVALAAYAEFVRVVERRAPSELAPRPALREAAFGAAVGALLFSATVG